jgi:hypothetical protein
MQSGEKVGVETKGKKKRKKRRKKKRKGIE